MTLRLVPKRDSLRVRERGEAPVAAAVFGDPVAHSLSPAMQNAAFRARGLALRYTKFRVPVPDLKAALAGVQALGYVGVNLTIPLKAEGARLVDRLTPEARRTGSVNTVTFLPGGTTEGDTTDGRGFLRSLRHDLGMGAQGRTVVMIGAGGASRAVAFALASAGARRITVLDIRVALARRLAGEVRSRTGVKVDGVPAGGIIRWGSLLGGADLLVNATPVGMKPGQCPLPVTALHRGLAVVDLIYNPPVTTLIREARRRGLKAVNGEGMLVNQGALSFERWTGLPGPVGVMRAALRRALEAHR